MICLRMQAMPVAVIAKASKSAGDSASAGLDGLTSEQARRLALKIGPNSMPDSSSHPARRAVGKLWAPVPWMLEASIVLRLILGKHFEAAVIGVLLAFNAVLSFIQEGRAQATLAALKSRLALTASVHRDGQWKTVPASDLVPGDVIKLSLGGVVRRMFDCLRATCCWINRC
jgi:H+-transporting ATPase